MAIAGLVFCIIVFKFEKKEERYCLYCYKTVRNIKYKLKYIHVYYMYVIIYTQYPKVYVKIPPFISLNKVVVK